MSVQTHITTTSFTNNADQSRQLTKLGLISMHFQNVSRRIQAWKWRSNVWTRGQNEGDWGGGMMFAGYIIHNTYVFHSCIINDSTL
jgi:hypothetical protein